MELFTKEEAKAINKMASMIEQSREKKRIDARLKIEDWQDDKKLRDMIKRDFYDES